VFISSNWSNVKSSGLFTTGGEREEGIFYFWGIELGAGEYACRKGRCNDKEKSRGTILPEKICGRLRRICSGTYPVGIALVHNR